MILKKIHHLTFLFILALSINANAQSQEEIRQSFLKPEARQQSVGQKIRKAAPRGFFKPFGKGTWISLSACGGTGAADILTQLFNERRGMLERNPLLRDKHGRLNVGRAVAIKTAICGGTLLLERKYPKVMFIIRTTFSVLQGGAAVWNASR